MKNKSQLSVRLLFWITALALLSNGAQVNAQTFDTFLEPSEITDINSVNRDRLSLIYVKNGDRVHKGQLLAELRTEVLKAQLVRAEKNSRLHGIIDSARLQVRMRSESLDMLRKLEKSGNARHQEMIAAETELAVVRAQLQAAIEEQQIRELEVQIIEAEITEKKLHSPIDGVVSKVYKHESELVGGNDPQPILTVVQLNPLKAIFHITPDAAEQLESDKEIPVTVSELKTTSRLEFKSPIINPQSGTVEVHLRIDNPEMRLVSGSRCRLDI
jgi:RND family efflux transporter MFP subunit